MYLLDIWAYKDDQGKSRWVGSNWYYIRNIHQSWHILYMLYHRVEFINFQLCREWTIKEWMQHGLKNHLWWRGGCLVARHGQWNVWPMMLLLSMGKVQLSHWCAGQTWTVFYGIGRQILSNGIYGGVACKDQFIKFCFVRSIAYLDNELGIRISLSTL